MVTVKLFIDVNDPVGAKVKNEVGYAMVVD